MPDFNVLNPNLIFDFGDLVPGGLRYFAFILRSDPLMYLRLQEASSGVPAEDYTAYDNDGTYSSTGILFEQPSPLTNDRRDYSILLDGGFLEVPPSPSLDQAFTSFGTDLWVKLPQLPESEATLVGRGDGPGNNNFQVSVIPDGRVKFWLHSAESSKIAYSDSPLVVNEWYHVMAIWDGTQTAIFLNGTEGTAVPHAPTLTTSNNSIQIGSYNNASRINAYIDEVAVYGQALDGGNADDRVGFHRGGNKAPVITSTSADGIGPGSTLTIFEGDTVTFEINAVDPEGDTLQYYLSRSGFIPEFGPQASSTFTQQFTESGFYYPVGFASDGRLNRAAPFATVKVEPIPDLKAFNDFYTTGYQRSKTLNVLSNDSFPSGGGSIDSWTDPSHGTLTLQGSGTSASFSYVPNTDGSGVSDTFEYTITNGAGAFETATVTVEVSAKQDPSINGVTYYLAPNTTATYQPQDNDSADPPSQTITLTTVQNPTDQDGSAVLDSANNQIQYTPPTDFQGTDTFVYEAEDEDGVSGSATVTINVTQVDFRATNNSYTVNYEDTRTFNVLGNDTTPYPDPLTISSITQPPAGEGTVTISGDSTAVIYTADQGFVGPTSFTYTMTDGTYSDTATISVTVRNDPPRTGRIKVSTTVDTPKTLDPLSVAYDREGETIYLVSFTQPTNGSVVLNDGGTAGDTSDDTLTYTPDTSFVGVDTFEYTIEDSIGQQDSGTAYVAVGYNMSIDVSPTLIPATEHINYSVDVTAQYGYDKSYTYFWDFGDGSTSTSRSGNHYFGGIGTFDVSCTVLDSYGVEKSLMQTVTVGANKRPVAQDVQVGVAEGKLLDFDPRENDGDPDGDRFAIVEVQGVSDLGGIVAINNDGSSSYIYDDFISYVHPDDVTTPFTDTFTYTIEDEYGLRDTATITVDVLANQSPVISDVIYRPTVYNTPADIKALDQASDPEGDDLFIQSISNVTNGTASIEGTGPNNYVSFTPPTDFLGVGSFDYTIRDEFHNTASSSVTVPVFGQYYPKMVFDDAPIGFWPFNEAGGIRAYDMMGTQATGTYVNQVERTQTGPLAKDLEVAANVDRGYITTPLTNLAPQITDQMTLEIWVKNTLHTSSSVISDFLTISNEGTRFAFKLKTMDGTKTLMMSDREVGEWYHIVLTYDGSWVRAYYDSFIIASTTHSGNVVLPSRFSIGPGMGGSVSMMALYNTALTQTQVETHYQEALGPVVRYDVQTPEAVNSGVEFGVVVKARDVTGKTVKTDNTTLVTVTSDDTIVFDADNDGNYGS